MSAHPWDEWAARRGVTRNGGRVVVEPPRPVEPERCWVHPDGCRSRVAGQPMYPVCEHGSRATFIGHAGDGYVLGAKS